MHVVKKTGRVALLFTILIAEENGKHGAHLAFIFTQVIKKVLGIVSLNFDSNFNHTWDEVNSEVNRVITDVGRKSNK